MDIKKSALLFSIIFLLAHILLCQNLFADDDILVGDSIPDTPQFTAPGRQSGRVMNDSNAEIYVFLTSSSGAEATKEVMPNQSIEIPEDTVEVRAELVDDSFGDQAVFVDVSMPDGSSRTFSSLPASYSIAEPQS